MIRTCETCQNTIPIKHGLYCHECRRLQTIQAHQEHLAFCSDYIKGKYGEIDQDEYITAEVEINRITRELNKLLLERADYATK